MPHLEPTDDQAVRLLSRLGDDAPFVAINLLRFRPVADYTADPHLAPDTPISGAEAYRRYCDHTLPFLLESGGRVLLEGDADTFFIGPADERWDHVLVIEQASIADFLAFAENEAYLAGLGHRTAALEDSRLLPVSPSEDHRP